MKSALPKVMHTVCGLPIVHFGVQAALDAGCEEVVVVVGHGREHVEAYLARAFGAGGATPSGSTRPARPVRTAIQAEPRGTGDAARAGVAALEGRNGTVLVLNGDVPLVRAEDLRAALQAFEAADAATALVVATCTVDAPAGYGRIVRGPREGAVAEDTAGLVPAAILEIREDRDLRSDAERAIREINAGIYAGGLAFFREALATLVPANAQGELYLTDVVAFANRSGRRASAVPLDADVLAGVNDREQLAGVEAEMHRRLVTKWRLAGATVRDGARLDAGVVLDADTTVEAGAVLRGSTRLERGARVDVGCVLTNVFVGAEAVLKPYTVGTDSRIAARAQVGPFAHLRPESDLGEDAHVGNFVETKKTKLGRGAKANHLAYLGDGVIGDGANIGAGTIFCNYDGVQKHTTTIGAGAFIGSDSQLVAPVTVGDNAYVATGTTVTQDVPPDALAIARIPQENKPGYATRLRARMKAAKEAAKNKNENEKR
jgi:bifunctional UDP-N-acetylglucosamine pyrophosphorylase/glucosamine-1-phosphate N-acetyltransferase